MQLKKNMPLIVGIAIPILMIVFVAGSIYIPSLFVHPRFDFIYTTDNTYDIVPFTVVNGKLTQQQPTCRNPCPTPPAISTLYIHETVTDTNKVISLNDAHVLRLYDNSQSPDGFTVEQGSYNDGFPFFFGGSSDYNNFYLKGGVASRKITLSTTQWNFHLVGWILP